MSDTVAVLLLAFPTWTHAAEPIERKAPKAMAVKQAPNEESRTLFYIQAGDNLWEYERLDEYVRVKAKRQGKWINGYVQTLDLEAEPEELKATPAAPLELAVGLGAVYSRLSQAGKTFQTDDQVQNVVSNFTSTSVWPALYAQLRRQGFWRAYFGYRLTQYRGTAKTDVFGASTKAVEVNHRMLAVGLLRALTFKSIYAGLGAEVARAVSMNVRYGGSELVTTDQDLPLYVSALAAFGGQWFLNSRFSLSSEARVNYVLNQSQTVYGIEVGAQAFYWF